MRRLPLAIQTNYAELLDQLRIAEFGVYGADVQFRLKTIKGRGYWYARSPTNAEGGRTERYLGPDTPELRTVIEGDRNVAVSTEGRRRIVKALLAAGLSGPDPISGAVARALAEAGVFRLRGVLVGTVAFQAYAAGLGVILPNAALRTGDLDIAQDYGVSLALDDATDKPMLDILLAANPNFRSVPSLDSPLSGKAFALPGGFRVDLLTTNRGSERLTSRLRALNTDAAPLRFMDFLLRDNVEAALLHDDGVLVRVPTPARFAVHKLLISRKRPPMSGKSPKDLLQAQTLIEALAEIDPFALREAWREARERGPKWRELLDQAGAMLEPSARAALES